MKCPKALYSTPELSYLLGYYKREVDIIHRINQELVTKYKKETTEL
jgi:hypothetical protein